jgi:nitrogen fixation NifU-like protein
MASASVMTQMVKESAVEEAVHTIREIVDMLNGAREVSSQEIGAERLALLDTVRRFPTRIRCAVLPWVTLEAALKNQADPVTVP